MALFDYVTQRHGKAKFRCGIVALSDVAAMSGQSKVLLWLSKVLRCKGIALLGDVMSR